MLYLAHIYVKRKAAILVHQHNPAALFDAYLLIFPSRAIHTSTPYFQTSSSPPNSPPKEKLKALPFLTSISQAQGAYDHFHRRSWFSSQLTPTFEHVKEVYLPWWVVSATADVTVSSAQVGMQWVLVGPKWVCSGRCNQSGPSGG